MYEGARRIPGDAQFGGTSENRTETWTWRSSHTDKGTEETSSPSHGQPDASHRTKKISKSIDVISQFCAMGTC